jgi:hypothetical protein
MRIRLFYGMSRPSISIDDPKANAYYRRACTGQTAAIALLEADLRVSWSNAIFSEVVTGSGNEPNPHGIARFLAATGLREQVLDVFSSGRPIEASLSLPNHIARRYWRGFVFGCQKNRPRNVLTILEPRIAVLQFESDTGHVTWRNEEALERLHSPKLCEPGREVWARQPFREIDWNELVVKELESRDVRSSVAVEISRSELGKNFRIRFVANSG